MTVLVLIRLRHYPFMDNATGGSIDGMIRLVNASLERVTDKTIIIPGHGPVGDRAQLIGFRDMLVAIRENVVRLKTQGKSLEEVLAAKPTAAMMPSGAALLSTRHSSPGSFTRA